MALDRRQFLVGAGASVGSVFAAEWKKSVDPQTGRTVGQLTGARANSYPLYYFSPSATPDGRYLVFHSERSGWVQLYRMDLESGAIAQLTDGHTRDSGWAIWCEPHLRGIFNHLSALNTAKREVYYFQEDEVRRTGVDSLENALVCRIPGRIPIGQSAFSPDGKTFGFIHADHDQFRRAYSDREALTNMGMPPDHEQWRNALPCTIGLIDTATARYRDALRLDYHVHHVIWARNDLMLINHPRNTGGMWTLRPDGTGIKDLRPEDAHGYLVHQLVTKRGIFYEATGKLKDGSRDNWLGRYDLDRGSFEEVLLPKVNGYLHTGWDPEGRFLFFENHGATHELLSLHFPWDEQRRHVRVLRSMARYPRSQQRYHAHPFLSVDRHWIYYTEVIDGFSQVCALDVADLVDLDEYWDRR